MKYHIIYKPKGKRDIDYEYILSKDYFVTQDGKVAILADYSYDVLDKQEDFQITIMEEKKITVRPPIHSITQEWIAKKKRLDELESDLSTKQFDENKLYRGLTGGQVTIAEMIQEMESIIPESHRKYVKFLPKIADNLDAMQWEYQLPDIKE